ADPRSWRLRFHSQTAGSSLTAQQPENNVIRVALQAMAAVFGGTQSLHTNSRDEALALPSAEAARIALRTQQIIAHESGVADTVDPLGGAYYLEYLTDELARRAEAYFETIAGMGGVLAAIESGYIQREIQESAYRFQRELESQQEITVGVNRYVEEEEAPIPLQRLDPAVEAAQRQRLAELRQRRDNIRVSQLRERLANAAGGDDNLVPHFVACVEGGVTLGEICDTLRRIWGEYEPATVI
ncbi:MAG: methylmalonyl-CoA mutase family protein, partial [Chloroflexota bacterium]